MKLAALNLACVLCFVPTIGCDPDNVEPVDEVEESKLDDDDANQSPAEADLPLAVKPNGSAGPNGTECCALCSKRNAYHAMWGVSNNCAYWGYNYCAANPTRGYLVDAAWLNPSQCKDP